MRKCLIVKLGAIGDVATVIPAAKLLVETGYQIDWLCGKAVAPLLSCYDWVNRIVVDDAILFGSNRAKAIAEVARTWSQVVGESYDLCAVLQYDIRFRLLTWPVRAKRKVALDRNRRELELVSERQHTAEYVRILCGLEDRYREKTYAPILPDILPENPLTKNDKTRVALVPGGARNLIREDPQRRWPVESYGEVADSLLRKGYEVVLTGGPSDDWVQPFFAGLPVVSAIGKWTIPQTIAFYNSCDCVVTHDTGPLHLAGLSCAPLVGLFGPTSPSKFLPRRSSVVALWGGERLACRPCYDGRGYAPCNWNGCMIGISPERVITAIEALLAHPGCDWRVENL